MNRNNFRRSTKKRRNLNRNQILISVQIVIHHGVQKDATLDFLPKLLVKGLFLGNHPVILATGNLSLINHQLLQVWKASLRYNLIVTNKKIVQFVDFKSLKHNKKNLRSHCKSLRIMLDILTKVYLKVISVLKKMMTLKI